MFWKISQLIRLKIHKRKWRAKNQNNFTTAETLFDVNNVTVGDYTYGPLYIEQYYPAAKLSIGKYCSIAKGVKFLLGGNHGSKAITTYPFGPRVYQQRGRPLKWKVDIQVEDDVWIGYEALILQGVKIGRGSIIGARSVVTKDVPPYSVYVGTRILKRRFPDDMVNQLMDSDYRLVCHRTTDSFEEYWHKDLDEENIDEIINAFIGRG